MPRTPSGGMSMPGGFGGMQPQINSAMGQAANAFAGPQFGPMRDKINATMTDTVNPMINKITANANLPPNIQAMIQSIMGGFGGSRGAPSPQAPAPPSPAPTAPTASGESPNDGVQLPSVTNTPSQNSPTTPFSMPRDAGTIPTAGQQPTSNNPGWGTQVPGIQARYWGALPSPTQQLGGVHMPVVK